MSAATYTADNFAELLGVSTWTIYEAVRQGTCPLEPIRVGGRRLVWPKADVDSLLGLAPGRGGDSRTSPLHHHQGESPATTAGPVATDCSSTPDASTAQRISHDATTA